MGESDVFAVALVLYNVWIFVLRSNEKTDDYLVNLNKTHTFANVIHISTIIMSGRRCKIAYVLTWSIGLLCASFPWIFEELFNTTSSTLFDFAQNYSEVFSKYVKTYAFTLTLFLIDCIYGALNRKNKSHDVVVLLICTLGVIASLLFSLCCNMLPCMNAILFLISWVFLTILKFHWTEERNPDTEELEVKLVPDN